MDQGSAVKSRRLSGYNPLAAFSAESIARKRAFASLSEEFARKRQAWEEEKKKELEDELDDLLRAGLAGDIDSSIRDEGMLAATQPFIDETRLQSGGIPSSSGCEYGRKIMVDQARWAKECCKPTKFRTSLPLQFRKVGQGTGPVALCRKVEPWPEWKVWRGAPLCAG